MAALRSERSISTKPAARSALPKTGKPKSLLLGDHPQVRADDVEEDGDVVVRLVVAHHQVGLAVGQVLAAVDLDLDAGVGHDGPGPAGEAAVTDLPGHLLAEEAERLDHRRKGDGKRLVDVAEGQGEGGAHARARRESDSPFLSRKSPTPTLAIGISGP